MRVLLVVEDWYMLPRTVPKVGKSRRGHAGEMGWDTTSVRSVGAQRNTYRVQCVEFSPERRSAWSRVFEHFSVPIDYSLKTY